MYKGLKIITGVTTTLLTPITIHKIIHTINPDTKKIELEQIKEFIPELNIIESQTTPTQTPKKVGRQTQGDKFTSGFKTPHKFTDRELNNICKGTKGYVIQIFRNGCNQAKFEEQDE